MSEVAYRPSCRTAIPVFEIFVAWKRNSWASAKRPSSRIAMKISHRFAAWQRGFWESLNQPNYWKPQPIIERFAHCKRDSCTSASRTTFRMVLVLFERFATRNHDFREIATRHNCCPYTNFSHPENSISEHLQIQPLAGWHSPHQNAIPVHHKIDHYAWHQYSYVNIFNPASANRIRFM